MLWAITSSIYRAIYFSRPRLVSYGSLSAFVSDYTVIEARTPIGNMRSQTWGTWRPRVNSHIGVTETTIRNNSYTTFCTRVIAAIRTQMSSAQAAARLADIGTHLQAKPSNMASAAPAASPVPVDNEIKGRLALVTGASGGSV